MPLSDNLRGALYMTIAMAAFTINDSLMKAATSTLHLPLWQAIAMRGLLTLGPLALIGVAIIVIRPSRTIFKPQMMRPRL